MAILNCLDHQPHMQWLAGQYPAAQFVTHQWFMAACPVHGPAARQPPPDRGAAIALSPHLQWVEGQCPASKESWI